MQVCPGVQEGSERAHVHHLQNKHITVQRIIIMAFTHMAIHLHSTTVCCSVGVGERACIST